MTTRRHCDKARRRSHAKLSNKTVRPELSRRATGVDKPLVNEIYATKKRGITQKSLINLIMTAHINQNNLFIFN